MGNYIGLFVANQMLNNNELNARSSMQFSISKFFNQQHYQYTIIIIIFILHISARPTFAYKTLYDLKVKV